MTKRAIIGYSTRPYLGYGDFPVLTVIPASAGVRDQWATEYRVTRLATHPAHGYDPEDAVIVDPRTGRDTLLRYQLPNPGVHMLGYAALYAADRNWHVDVLARRKPGCVAEAQRLRRAPRDPEIVTLFGDLLGDLLDRPCDALGCLSEAGYACLPRDGYTRHPAVESGRRLP
jgi:hypothetical protein